MEERFLSLYRSPSQNKDDIETFLENLELNFDHMAKKTLSRWLFLVILTQSLNLGMFIHHLMNEKCGIYLFLFIYSLRKVEKFTIKTDIILYTTKIAALILLS